MMDQTAPEQRSATVGSRSRGERVYAALCEAIRDGRLARGERIREEELARTLGVSRTPVREALHRLEERGLVANSRAGLVVAELSRSQTLELYAMREILEGSAARFAAQRASDAEIAILRRLNRDFAAAADKPSVAVAVNRRFHQALYDAAHNRYLLQMLETLHDTLALLRDTTLAQPGRAQAAVEEHEAILAAVARRDLEAAEAAARRHIHEAQALRIALMAEGEEGYR